VSAGTSKENKSQEPSNKPSFVQPGVVAWLMREVNRPLQVLETHISLVIIRIDRLVAGNIAPGLDAAVLLPGVVSSATSNNRNELSVSSLRTPKSTHVTRAFSAELLSTEPTRGMRLSKDHTSDNETTSVMLE
jgi:hypothetical protein